MHGSAVVCGEMMDGGGGGGGGGGNPVHALSDMHRIPTLAKAT